MKDKTIMTENVSRFFMLMKSLITKPARIDKLGLVYGRWGLGKSTAIEMYFSNQPCFYARALSGWSRSACWMLEDMLKAYRVEAMGKVKHDLRELVRVMKKHGTPFLIDEADRVVRKSFLMEMVRDLVDLSKVPVCLIGQENIYSSLQRKDLGNVFSRISETLEFCPLTARDIQLVSKELCDLKCNAEAASMIRNLTLGDFRLVNALLTRIEQMCLLNSKTEISLGIIKEAAKPLPNLESLKGLTPDSPREDQPQRAAA